jgi:acetate kinase
MVERSASGMNVLVINCGSSSIKYGVYEMPSRTLVGKGIMDRIGQKPSWLKYEHGDREEAREVEIEDHRQGVHLILDSVLDEKGGPVGEDETIDVVGHRVVHGGTIESEAAFIDDDIMGVIERFAPMAPLHNPPDLMAIRTVAERMRDVPQVACWDCRASHATCGTFSTP